MRSTTARPARRGARSAGRALLAGALVVLAGSAAAAAAPGATAVRPARIAFTETVLPNGLRVIVHEDHSTPIVSVQVWYHAGSKNDPEGRAGLAHLVEHLMFTGSMNVEAGRHAAAISGFGGQSNAYTTEDVTVFWNTVPAQHLPAVLWMEADRMAALRLDARTFGRERDVVVEERRMRVESQPYGRMTDILYGLAFRVHPYGNSSTGSTDGLAAASVGDAREFYRAYYVPGNATLAIAGDVDPRQAADLAAQYFGRIPKAGPVAPRGIPGEPPARGPRRATVEEAWPLPVVVVAHRVPEDGHPDSYPLRIAAKILSDGRNARLYRALVYDTGMAMSAGAVANLTEDPNLFYAFAIVQPGHAPSEARTALEWGIDQLRKAAVTEAELARAKLQFARDAVLGRETVRQKAAALAQAAVLRGGAAAADDDLDRLHAVTAADILRAAQAYFGPEARIAVTVVPKAAEGERK